MATTLKQGDDIAKAILDRYFYMLSDRNSASDEGKDEEEEQKLIKRADEASKALMKTTTKQESIATAYLSAFNLVQSLYMSVREDMVSFDRKADIALHEISNRYNAEVAFSINEQAEKLISKLMKNIIAGDDTDKDAFYDSCKFFEMTSLYTDDFKPLSKLAAEETEEKRQARKGILCGKDFWLHSSEDPFIYIKAIITSMSFDWQRYAKYEEFLKILCDKLKYDKFMFFSLEEEFTKAAEKLTKTYRQIANDYKTLLEEVKAARRLDAQLCDETISLLNKYYIEMVEFFNEIMESDTPTINALHAATFFEDDITGLTSKQNEIIATLRL